MPRARIRIGLIGFGEHARAVLLPSLTALVTEAPGRLELTCVATATAASARRAQSVGLVAHIGYEALLDRRDVDAVVIAGPSARLAAMTIAALEAGKHAFVEAPGVADRAELDRVAATARGTDRVLAFGACLRHMPAYQVVAERLGVWRSKGRGPVVLHIRYFEWRWFHYDLSCWLLGAPEKVRTVRLAGHELSQVVFDGGDVASIAICPTRNPSIPLEEVVITGAAGWIAVENGITLREQSGPSSRFTFAASGGRAWSPSSLPYGGLNLLALRGYIPELEDFVAAIRDDRPPLAGPAELAATTGLLAAVDASAESGNEILVAR